MFSGCSQCLLKRRSDHSEPIDCEVRCPRSPIEITPCPLLHAETTIHRRGTTTPASCTVCSISRAFQDPSSSATDQRDIAFYVAEILDPANFKVSYGSCEKDDNRESAAAAVEAAGRLVSSSSAAAYILGAIPKISVRCE